MTDAKHLRTLLVDLVEQIVDARDHGIDDAPLLAKFTDYCPCPDISNLCNSDYSIETIVDISLGYEGALRVLSREQLTALVESIREVPAKTEAEAVLRVIAFNSNCRHAASSDLLFYPKSVFGDRSPTVKDIVDAAVRGVP